jgi:phage tail sheath protein FI
MAFQVSPGVLVQEKDLTRIIPAVATSTGAFAGEFRKGPLDEIVTISSEQELVETFGKPDSLNYEDWFSAANFLQYSNALRVVRATQTGTSNASVSGTNSFVLKNTTDYINNFSTGQGSVGEWAARTAGKWGNSLSVSICPSSTAFESSPSTTSGALSVGDTTVNVTSGTNYNVGDIIQLSTTAAGSDFNDGYLYKITAKSTNALTIVRYPTLSGGIQNVVVSGATVKRRWAYYDQVSSAPGTSTYASAVGGSGDELHVVVVDATGGISGIAGTVLETYSKLSKASDAKSPQGDSNYYPSVIFSRSNYIYWMDHNTGGVNWGNTAASTTFTSVTAPITTTLTNGLDSTTDNTSPTTAQKKTAYEKFLDAETVDVGLIIAGPAGSTTTHIDNIITIAENRKDCVAFVSPKNSDVVNVANSNTQLSNVLTTFSSIRSSSYVVFDSGYKYQYDRYNDVYRYVPLNGDIAGLAARTDLVADSWYSPAGFNRGTIRGAVKLAFNPNKTQRDDLYRNRVNAVVTFPGQGTVLFGDKTGLSAPSAFDRINVRRLFIVLEKAISTASKFQLFEFNDEFTRANFRNIVEPFLREVQGRRGITNFKVVCDETNNTGEVIDRNEFVAEIYIKPARSINFITLSFIATRTGVSFSEVAGG